MNDPTYDKKAIDADELWKLAFWMSEVHNDYAPIGWSRYIPLARLVNERFSARTAGEKAFTVEQCVEAFESATGKLTKTIWANDVRRGIEAVHASWRKGG